MLTNERIEWLYGAHLGNFRAFARAIEREARREALEEAAKLCDSFDERECCSVYCARHIRALIPLIDKEGA